MMDFEKIASEYVRSLRGRRSQAQLSRRLGYASNVVFDWEAGRRFPTAAVALRIAQNVGVDLHAAMAGFFRRDIPELAGCTLASPEGVAALLGVVRGAANVGELAQATGASRFQVSRWLRGQCEPRLPDFLHLISTCSLRLIDFVASLTDVERMPSLHDDYLRLAAARQLAYAMPWSHAVLRAVELESYLRLPRHRPGFFASVLGISLSEEQRCLEQLVAAGQLTMDAGKYRLDQTQVIDTRADPARSRALRAFWSRVAAERLEAGAEGDFAFNCFGVSLEDFERIRALQRSYFRELRAIVAQSQPTQAVVLANWQLFALSAAVGDNA